MTQNFKMFFVISQSIRVFFSAMCDDLRFQFDLFFVDFFFLSKDFCNLDLALAVVIFLN